MRRLAPTLPHRVITIREAADEAGCSYPAARGALQLEVALGRLKVIEHRGNRHDHPAVKGFTHIHAPDSITR